MWLPQYLNDWHLEKNFTNARNTFELIFLLNFSWGLLSLIYVEKSLLLLLTKLLILCDLFVGIFCTYCKLSVIKINQRNKYRLKIIFFSLFWIKIVILKPNFEMTNQIFLNVWKETKLICWWVKRFHHLNKNLIIKVKINTHKNLYSFLLTALLMYRNLSLC